MEQSASAAAYQPGETSGGRASGRFWSTRRLSAGLLALALLAASALLLYDIAAVRAGRPAMAWRRWLADELAAARLDSAGVRIAAALAVLLGLWLLLLALTPGRRGLLPMRRVSPHVRAGLERRAAALVLRDRGMDVSGVHSLRVRVRRRRVRVRAQAHFRELDAVRADLDGELERGIEQLGLDRQPALSVRVRRAARP
nr:DUF6286 domain-containing protein [Streptomyces sp. AJS327]